MSTLSPYYCLGKVPRNAKDLSALDFGPLRFVRRTTYPYVLMACVAHGHELLMHKATLMAQRRDGRISCPKCSRAHADAHDGNGSARVLTDRCGNLVGDGERERVE